MKNFLLQTLLFLIVSLAPIYSEAKARECIILLHGLARSHYCMSQLAFTLARYHYIVINEDYPSTSKSIKELSEEDLLSMIEKCKERKVSKINFVTHSMGGIILQKHLENHTIPKLGRIVMLSPPNHGSAVADLLHDNWLFKKITGPAGQELTTCADSIPNSIKLHRQYEIGIITGTFSFVPFSYYIFNDINDGAVSVSSAKSNVMTDFMTFPSSHPFIMVNTSVHEQILFFLKHGKFNRQDN